MAIKIDIFLINAKANTNTRLANERTNKRTLTLGHTSAVVVGQTDTAHSKLTNEQCGTSK